MKEKKRRMELYSFYDRTGIERHLGQMAEKGWRLEKIENNIWHYRRTAPGKVSVTVTYFPKASELDPEPSEEQKQFYDFCEHTGWKLAAASAQLQIFYNEDRNPVPIATDPGLELETVHRSARRGFLPALWIILAFAVIMLGLSAVSLYREPGTLSLSSTMLFTDFAYVLLLIYCLSELADYYSWYFRAREAAVRGEFLETKSRIWLAKLILAAVFLAFLFWIINRVSTGPIWQRTVGIITAFGIIAILNLGGWIKIFLKKRKFSPGLNRAVTFTVIIVLCVAFTALMVRVGIGMARREARLQEQNETTLTGENLSVQQETHSLQ